MNGIQLVIGGGLSLFGLYIIKEGSGNGGFAMLGWPPLLIGITILQY